MALKRLKWNSEEKSKQLTGFEKWGNYMEAKIQKLDEQYLSEATKDGAEISTIFNGISIMVNGYTVPSAEELRKLLMLNGGKYCNYDDGQVTHIIASNLPQVKIKRLKKEKVVKPGWITESVKAGRLLPYKQFLLYNTGTLEGQMKIEPFRTSELSRDQTGPKHELSESEQEFELRLSDSDDSCVRNQGNCEKEIELNQTSEEKAMLPSSTRYANIPKAGEANFISSYYNHSRLHHISSASNNFKEYVNGLRGDNRGDFPGRELLKQWKAQNGITDVCPLGPEKHVYMHIDMDCFFVSVGLRDRPHLKGKPVAVTHARGKPKREPNPQVQREWEMYQARKNIKGKNFSESLGSEMEDKRPGLMGENEFFSMAELASCNYEARKFGVRNGTMLGRALQLCPDLQLVPFDFDAYSEVSSELYKTVASCTLEIEALSCDELLIDCLDVLKATNTSPLDFAAFLRQEIYKKTLCTASTGLGCNILLARLATRKAKPNGQFYVTKEDESEFMEEQLVRNLPGVGSSTSSRLEDMGILTCKNLREKTLTVLQKEFGPKAGKTLYSHCRGKDDRTIQTQKERKSVSAEINYGMRFTKVEEPEGFLRELSEEVEKRLKKINRKGKLITLKIKVKSKDAPVESAKYMGHGICDNVTRSVLLKMNTDSANIIGNESVILLRQMNLLAQDIRGMGIQVTKLDVETKSRSLFEFMKVQSNNESRLGNAAIIIGQTSVQNCVARSAVRENSKSDLPSQCQLDMSVLSALPDDIRKEVLEAYSTFPSKDLAQQSEQTSKASPLKKSSPSKREPKRNSKITAKKMLERILPVQLDQGKVIITRKEVIESQPEPSHLCGATQIEDQKRLLLEWINFSEPVEEDLDMFASFLSSLVRRKELEKLDVIIKYLYRNISSGKCYPDWKIAYNSLINNLQPLMIQCFDHTLRVETFHGAS